MFVVHLHEDNVEGVALEGRLMGQAANLATFSQTFGSSDACYFNFKKWAGFFL